VSQNRSTRVRIGLTLVAAFLGFAISAFAVDDTARFNGTWEGSILFNGQTVTIVSVHTTGAYKNYMRLPNGNTPAGDGTFSASNGRYSTSAEKPNDSGIYRFTNNDTIVCTNSAGQTVTWKRAKASAPASIPPPATPAPTTPPPAAPRASAPPPAATLAPDPNLPPETNSAIAAFNRKDYNTAWRDFIAAAQKGDSEAQAGVGSMLFHHLNPPGTGYYAQCEKWLQASANQGNVKGMDFLGQYYYASGVSIAGGINPGINNSPIPPALKKQAEGQFALARQWFDRASAKNDGYAMGNLAIMLDAGVGGPADPARAAQLREQIKNLNSPARTDPDFVKRATADPENQAMKAAWQAGHYAEAIQNAQIRADRGDANAQALLGKAYYEGVGVTRNYATALIWLNKAVAQNNPDAMFVLGLMYELGRGVKQDLNRAIGLFDKAAGLGQRYAQMEAKGMRMQGAADAQQARFAAVCRAAGGVTDGPLCLSGGMAFDPYH
jgi:TPR repeat protein